MRLYNSIFQICDTIVLDVWLSCRTFYPTQKNPLNHGCLYVGFRLYNIPFIFQGNVCAEYNYGGGRIQRNGNVNCEECPSYFSNESYKYQECYEYVKNVKTSQTTQLTTESKDKESTTQGMIYLSSSLTPNEESARLYQDTDTPKTSSHIIIIVICVVVGLAAIAVVFTVKQRSLTGKLFACFKKTVLQNEDLNAQPSEIVIESVEEGLEVKTVLLDKRTHTFIQDTFRELNES
eukprot:XP_019919692.1 PREDICTED: uncharacterized protein LOC105320456 isoform X4 [Crassostrea gigas]